MNELIKHGFRPYWQLFLLSYSWTKLQIQTILIQVEQNSDMKQAVKGSFIEAVNCSVFYCVSRFYPL